MRISKPQRRLWLTGLGVVVLISVILVSVRILGSHTLSIEDCGAVADDGQDDVEAIQACIDQAQDQRKPLLIPEGQYEMSRSITLTGMIMKGEGAGSILVSTNPAQGSIILRGEGVELRDLTHRYASVVARGDGANEKNSITVTQAEKFGIHQVTVHKASTAGILVTGGSRNGQVMNNVIQDTGADGIHITGESSNITVEGNKVSGTGDDAIAVVSYKEDKEAVRDIQIRKNNVGYGSSARGISVVGGKQVLIDSNTVQDTSMAGIYLASEKNWNTADTLDITVTHNEIHHTGTRAGSGHPNLLIYASHGKVDRIRVEDNILRGAEHDGIGIWGEGEIGEIQFSRNQVEGSRLSPTKFMKGTVSSDHNLGF
ncbi:right-handed parallel beta-helix repeat-containing protein [Paenibacillus sp. F411]|uniref:right-handed parallel beta-helix repeat-containing protein n=1 Tax=Paenibacillus sp. F411 TaxID=2820239 RepID=UPI001AAF519B|nr:right-handed parallel beta-helix repeat-containing protein [Paenibacillus sp. F411]MBO2944225.1 right-handed parallel beta-helix repeat-containing protein [Paenibacillus sp. F411]